MSDSCVAITVATPDGPFTYLIEQGDGAVLAAGWTDDAEGLRLRIAAARRPAQVGAAPERVAPGPAEAIARYYAFDPAGLATIRVSAPGTALQQAVWNALRTIAVGTTVSYTQLAAAAGSPGAVRAAASACARNPTGLFVPCHRVVRGDGSLGGFAWGLPIKEAVLARELTMASA